MRPTRAIHTLTDANADRSVVARTLGVDGIVALRFDKPGDRVHVSADLVYARMTARESGTAKAFQMPSLNRSLRMLQEGHQRLQWSVSSGTGPLPDVRPLAAGGEPALSLGALLAAADPICCRSHDPRCRTRLPCTRRRLHEIRRLPRRMQAWRWRAACVPSSVWRRRPRRMRRRAPRPSAPSHSTTVRGRTNGARCDRVSWRRALDRR